MSRGLPVPPAQLFHQRESARYQTVTGAKSAAEAGMVAPPGPERSEGTKSTLRMSRAGSTEKEMVSISPCAAAQARALVTTPWSGGSSGRYGLSP